MAHTPHTWNNGDIVSATLLNTLEQDLANTDTAGAAATAQAYAVQRGNHTGTQTSASISDFVEAVQDAVAAFFVNGTNITSSYNDAANTFTVTASGTGGGVTDPEVVRDTIGAALIGVGPVAVTINDAADTITITSSATVNSTDAALRDRSTHTGTQPASTITGLAVVATSGSYTDLSNTLGTASNPVTNATAARPTGIPKVFWQCPTQPTNWIAGDEWINNS